MSRIALFLLLLCLSSLVAARDVRMHGANGDGGACPDASPTRLPVAPGARHAARAAPSNRSKVKAPAPFQVDEDDASPHAPRWHSFLPGMFR